MNRIVQFIIRLYALVLRLFPSHFYAEFGEEMTAVFTQALIESKENSPWVLVSISWRELRDLPLALLREHLLKPREKTTMAQFIQQLSNLEDTADAGQDGPATRWDIVLALIPFLWPALGLLTPLLAAIFGRWIPANTQPEDAPQWLITLIGTAVVGMVASMFRLFRLSRDTPICGGVKNRGEHTNDTPPSPNKAAEKCVIHQICRNISV